MLGTNLINELEERIETIKDFRIQFNYTTQRIDVKSILIDKNQKELFLRGFSQGKDIPISTVEDFLIALEETDKTTKISSLDVLGETSASNYLGSNISGFFIEEDTKTVVFSWLIDEENPNHISFEG